MTGGKFTGCAASLLAENERLRLRVRFLENRINGVAKAIDDCPEGLRQIIRDVCARRGVDQVELAGPRKFRRLFLARKEVATLATAGGFSSATIAWAMGGRDHSTVLNYLNPKKRRPRNA